MIVIYAPFPSPVLVRDGWMRRIATLERIFENRERHYVFPGDAAWSVDPRDYRVHTHDVAEGAKFTWVDMRFSNHHRFLSKLIDSAEFVYAHTSHSAQHLLPYYGTGKIITDLHGIAPEEEELQGKSGRAAFYGALEEVMVRNSALLVSVTESMVEHMRAKYPGLDTDTVLLPIVEDIEQHPLERPTRDRVRVVYAGGLQRWQNVERMLEVVAQCRDTCEFEFYTDAPDRLREMAREASVLDAIRVATAPPEKLPEIYGEADLGFVLRDDIAVNRVSCPTKLSEYLACGVVPVVDLAAIGDFDSLGYRYVTVVDLCAGRLPDADERADMRRQNRAVFERVQQRFEQGRERLSGAIEITAVEGEQRALQLTTLERSMFYPRRGTKLEVVREDGVHAIAFDDVVSATCDHELELPGSGPLREVRFCPGDAPFVTTPIELHVVLCDGVRVPVPWNHAVEVDCFGNWLFGGLGSTVSVDQLELADAARLHLRFEYLLIGPESLIAGVEQPKARSPMLRRLAQVPGARPMWAMLQNVRRRLGLSASR